MNSSKITKKLLIIAKKGLNIIKKLSEILYPTTCHFCGKVSPQEICSACRREVLYVEEPRCKKCGKPVKRAEQEYCHDCEKRTYAYEEGRSIWLHQGRAAWSVYQFKYHNKRYFTKFYAKEWVRLYGKWLEKQKFDVLVPVPVHPKRLRKRGYNQARILAKELSALTGIPEAEGAVIRIHNTKPQKTLRPEERRKNLMKAFAVAKWDRSWENVLIIDDIYTTGSTVNAIARLLKEKGARKVCFLTVNIGQGF